MKKTNPDLALLLIRIATGGLMLFYGVYKILNGHGYIKEYLSGIGLPKFLWIGVPLAEVLAPICILLGVFTRISGLLLAVLIVFTLTYWGIDAFTLNDFGGIKGDLNIYFFLSGLALFFSGPGRFTVYRNKNSLFS